MKALNPSLCILATQLALLPACGLWRIEGSGRSVEDRRALPPFDRLEVRAGLRVSASLGAQAVVLTGDDNILPQLRTWVQGTTLVFAPEEDFHPVSPLSLEVTAPALLGARFEAGSELVLLGITGQELELTGKAGGAIVASGQVDHLTVKLSAGGDIDTSDLPARRVDLFGEAGGTLRVTATEEVVGLVESGSIAEILGSPARRSVDSRSGGEVIYSP